MVADLLRFHRVWGYVAIAANAVAGVIALIAWKVPRARGRWVWIVTIVAESAMLLQILVGATVVASDNSYGKLPGVDFHMFYGFVTFITVGLAYQYRDSMRRPVGRMQLFYGLVGLFIMGLGIRAVVQVA